MAEISIIFLILWGIYVIYRYIKWKNKNKL